MRRTGKSFARWFLLVLVCGALPALADAELYQQADRREVGLDDPFQVTVMATNVPDGSSINFPESPNFETLGRSESQSTSFELINGQATIKHSRTYTLTLKALRTGKLQVPPSVLSLPDGTAMKTDPIAIVVRPGHVRSPVAQRPRGIDPFSAFGFNFPHPPPMPDIDVDDDQDQSGPDLDISIPHSDSDLFIRASLDKSEVYVGEQATLTLYLYSRVDLAQVDPVEMPKLDGFWTEDIESPTTLAAQPEMIHGVPYRAYLLKKRALFPMRPGVLKVDPAEADITTGLFFASRRVHRMANTLTLKVKPLPPGAPAGFVSSNVGNWKLTVESSAQQTELGSPVTVRVSVQGTGNVRNIALPRLKAPPGLRVYDPTTTEKVWVERGKVNGKRTQEYLVVPQQTGSFTLGSLELPTFNPEGRTYAVSRTDPLTLTVQPSSGGTAASPPLAGGGDMAKNVLSAGGIRPPRVHAVFWRDDLPLWQRPYFLVGVLTPPGAWLALGLLGFVRLRLSREDEEQRAKKKTRAAKGRLAAAYKLAAGSDAQAFFAEVEHALATFLEAKLKSPVQGLTRHALDEKLAAFGVAQAVRSEIRGVLDECDFGRFAPGSTAQGREQLADRAAAIIDGWVS